MSKIIKERECKTETYYDRFFERHDERNCGFVFYCDENGNLNFTNEAQKTNFEYALNHPEIYHDCGVKKHKRSYTEPAILLCDCGHEVQLTSFTNTCDHCESDYNISGQKLAPRSQWGWDTGETADEILSYNYMSTDKLLTD